MQQACGARFDSRGSAIKKALANNNIRVSQQFAVPFVPAREFLLGPFLVTAPLRRHLGHNPQSRFLRSRWLAFRLKVSQRRHA
jgi:hypothetical protein